MRLSIVLIAMLLQVVSAQACELPAGGTVLRRADGTVSLSYRPDPAPLATDETFAVIVDVCSKTPVEALRVDAHMPEHRHGMNYTPSVKRLSAIQFRADGLLFHMPGKWEFIFEVRSGGATKRLTHARQVQ